MQEDLLRQLQYELGIPLQWDEMCPGVYYMVSQALEGGLSEYYVAFTNAPISHEARELGQPLENAHARAFLLGREDGLAQVVEYEVMKYKIKHSIALPENTSLREIALYGMELCPDYFGTCPVPPRTPWGYTLRHRALDAGVFWIETDKCLRVLAVCHPVWATELSDGLRSIAQSLNDNDQLGYLFFPAETACAAIWELLRIRPALVSTGLIRKAELMNAIWKYHPEYAMGHNAQELSGLNDGLGQLLHAIGVEDRELECKSERMIAMISGVGVDFIGFWN